MSTITASNSTSNTASSSTPTVGPADTLSIGAKAGIGAGATVIAILIVGMLSVYCWRRKWKTHVSTTKSEENVSWHEMAHQPSRALDEREPSLEPSALLPTIEVIAASPVEEMEPAQSSPIEQLPQYPQSPALENQEPKCLNQVLENGEQEPKSLNTPTERPGRLL
jgi:hypothetical protein